MKLVIASDIHGSAYYCRAMLDAFRRRSYCCWETFSTTAPGTTCPGTMLPKRSLPC